MQRRFSWRNERSLYRRKCDATGKDIVSGFSTEKPVKVYERDYWWSDAWDPVQYGQDYDFNKPFFKQFRELLEHVPMPSVFNARTINCPYSQHTGELKDGYLVFASWDGENITYASRCHGSKDATDVYAVYNCELCYEDIQSSKLARTFFSQRSENCADSWFLFDCKGCVNCFGCSNLRNKSYYIFNQPYNREEYFKKIKELDTGSYEKLEKLKIRFEELKQKSLHKHATLVNAPDSTGDNMTNVARCLECFDFIKEAQDCKYCINGGYKANDMYDCYGTGASAELIYESFDGGVQGSSMYFTGIVYGGHNIEYSYNCTGSSNIFGCIGLRNKQFCILNKQYTRDEYFAQISKIKDQMSTMPYIDKIGREYKYGEFFPNELSPFAYNETIAQDFFPMTEEEIKARGLSYKQIEISHYQATTSWEDLPDNIKDADESILSSIISCQECPRVYRIIEKELSFLKRFDIALPRLCPECRHLKRFKQVNFPRLYKRLCSCNRTGEYSNTSPHSHGSDSCPTEFQTTYAPDRPEIVYCEQCYQREVA